MNGCGFDFIFWKQNWLRFNRFSVSLLFCVNIPWRNSNSVADYQCCSASACSYSPRETTPKPETSGPCGTAKQLWAGGWVRAGLFPLNFKRSIHECNMHKQITGKRDLPQGNAAPGSSLCQSCVWRIVCLLQMGFRKIWKRYDQNLGQNSDLEIALLIATI